MDLKKILPFFSYLFHPLFISVYAALFYFFVTKDFFYPYEIFLILFQIAILTVFLPISMYFLLKSLGLAKSSIMLHEKKERRLPLAFQAMFYLVLIEHSFSTVVVPELYYFFLGALISTILTLILIVLHFKASIHMIAMTGMTLFIIAISMHYGIPFVSLIAFLIIMVGFVASSRLYMQAHTMKELLVGILVGTLPQIALWHFWL
ncbi:hypothetical protein FCR2A7T_02210 [Flavobacterium cauense R2A-7]|uniref:PAP2 superfamily protein n=1 Tax=Flavobacterium cauense R2A-7 TaxID=1341154 RepID=V6S509_9FLAO|nr:hypothetical protein [Flavobacterium cauense]ESU21763.1 hypothetical protein FCR2A7T_02210 [Flavobacterium cauense R2A-7]KGO80996.1 hypothetical protein Q762_10160 [Flavobacterium cauense R2A-7]TWI12910.1 hypothetical protein IP98_01388 [Flavobacterium cauense R2A-7]